MPLLRATLPLAGAIIPALLPVVVPMPARAAAELPTVPPAASCASLSGTDLAAIGGDGSAVTGAEETTSDGIAVCSVTGTLAPEINFQVLLPMETWTQRYLQVGCGGLCGNITLRSGASAGCQVLNDGGFVMAATDMGHTGNSGEWGLDAQKRADFAYRAQHATAEAAKSLIAAFYGQEAAYSYFNGCSDGGREALMEAMRFPGDFDGIVAGAPAMLFQVQNTLYHGWQAASNYDADGEVILTSAELPVLHDAVLAECDALDGVEDGLISQPAECHFDPQTLVGKGLTQAQADVAAKFYAGPQDAQTGGYLTAGQPLYGSELEWQGVYVADNSGDELFSEMIVDPVLKYLAFATPDPEFGLKDLEFTEATLDKLRARHPLFDATHADLSGFAETGGKLILWHGLADPHISPANTLSLHQAMAATMGEDAVAGFERLYLIPGMGHCGGGRGPTELDLLSPMMDWVESGKAPETVLTRSTAETSSFGQPDGVGEGGGRRPMADLGVAALPDMTRPVYPWPHVSAFSGEGDYTDAASWSEGPAAQVVALRDWPGADLFGTYPFADE
ncbi:tannase/feruloyl esterase family alpha/beta hydrolase [Poseidonocella sp. HB161398]|uniref:tannase/feruloyl esterase family alpha/beta hydrolase n=1 Tax=Poseidonocella sp. HB161398 TaxID=2320855 RepID=UPI001486799B|nr:tannase/feruloyl esterase family alpha/beta hydrolase [Poseidonocella sp. HB161398]